MTEDQPSTRAVAESIPATVDVQDPLPETDWRWRRLYTYVLTLVCCIFVGVALEWLHDLRAGDHIYRLAKLLVGVIVMMATYYMVAPSAEQIVRMIQAARTLRAGIPITRRSVVETPQGRAESVSEAGVPPKDPPTQGPSQRRPEAKIDTTPEEAPWS